MSILTVSTLLGARDLWPDTSDEALNHVAGFQSYLEKVESA